MPLGLEVMVLPRVAPGHGACTVPKRREEVSSGMDSAGRNSRVHRSPISSPGDVQKNDALGFQVLDLGGYVYSITLDTGTGECWRTCVP